VRAIGEPDLASAVRMIAEWTGMAPQDVEHLVASVVGASTLAHLRDPARLLHLVECLEWMRKTGCDAESLLEWSAPTLGMAAAARAPVCPRQVG
jgi:hypothetical protein